MYLVQSCWTLLLWRPSDYLELNLSLKKTAFAEMGTEWATVFFVTVGGGPKQSLNWKGGYMFDKKTVGVLARGLKHQDKVESGSTFNGFISFLCKRLGTFVSLLTGTTICQCTCEFWGRSKRFCRLHSRKWVGCSVETTKMASYLLFSSLPLLLFSLSLFSSFSLLPQLLLWFKTIW